MREEASCHPARLAYGEALAIVEAYHQCEGNTVIWSDCQAAVKLWRRCLRAGAKRYAGALQLGSPPFSSSQEAAARCTGHVDSESFD